MHDEAHVGLVDAHAEGDGRRHDQPVLLQEGVLIARAVASVHAGVIGQGAKALAVEEIGQLLGLLARGAVDDAAFAGFPLDEIDDLAARLVFRAHGEAQIGAVEAMDEDGRLAGEEARLDLAARGGIGGGGEGDALHLAEARRGLADGHVFRAEIMPPLRDAMRLVDGEKAYA